MTKWDSSQGCKDGKINIIHHINNCKDKNHMIISIDVEKAFDKIQHPFMIKNTQQSGSRGSMPQHNKGHIRETYSQHHTQWAKTKSFPTKTRNKTRMSTFTTSKNIALEVLVTTIRQEKEIKSTQTGKEEAKLSLFADDMIVYIENPIDYNKKLFDLISESGKTAGYKVNIQNSKAFLYANNEILEREIRGGNPI